MGLAMTLLRSRGVVTPADLGKIKGQKRPNYPLHYREQTDLVFGVESLGIWSFFVPCFSLLPAAWGHDRLDPARPVGARKKAGRITDCVPLCHPV